MKLAMFPLALRERVAEGRVRALPVSEMLPGSDALTPALSRREREESEG
ncbi:hypothetical protein GMPD_00690 [Geomonas paludis]|uniref:Uncharacterized protein n=1 Tax=Geomonas paludis TaxID=2740185 RepID=A0A6V8MQ38_9BACT|nr:hypothetical protein GMPD_00690 [Geomonas paludis]